MDLQRAKDLDSILSFFKKRGLTEREQATMDQLFGFPLEQCTQLLEQIKDDGYITRAKMPNMNPNIYETYLHLTNPRGIDFIREGCYTNQTIKEQEESEQKAQQKRIADLTEHTLKQTKWYQKWQLHITVVLMIISAFLGSFVKTLTDKETTEPQPQSQQKELIDSINTLEGHPEQIPSKEQGMN